jgi:hypothetical protein
MADVQASHADRLWRDFCHSGNVCLVNGMFDAELQA